MKHTYRIILLSLVASIFSIAIGYLLNSILISICLMAGLFAGAFMLHRFYYAPEINVRTNTIRSFRSDNAKEKQQEYTTVFNQLDNEISAWAEESKAETERLNKLENYRKEYLGNVSHELKTPIFNIQGYLHTLIDGGLHDESINMKYLLNSSKSVERMIAIVEDLETISRYETGELVLAPESFDIIGLFRDVIESNELKAHQKKITLVLKNQASECHMVFADRQRIRQVLTNLISNSIRYGKENGETKIKVSDLGEKIHVEVADNGIGIDAVHQNRIFERFYRVDKSRSSEHGGTGLGLAIVKHIIEAHRQNIEVISTLGIGTVMTFSLNKPNVI